jgi:hypothetical protein
MKANPLSNLEVIGTAARWGVEHRSANGRWVELFTLGTRELAVRMLTRLCGSVGGDWCIRKPKKRGPHEAR